MRLLTTSTIAGLSLALAASPGKHKARTRKLHVNEPTYMANAHKTDEQQHVECLTWIA
jgi:hypothetical protein